MGFLKRAISKILKPSFFKQMISNLWQFQVLICLNVLTLKNQACPACGVVMDQFQGELDEFLREIRYFSLKSSYNEVIMDNF